LKVSYGILHWNRPYFAQVHLELARHYFPFVNEFVLLDDGSDLGCIDKLAPFYDRVIRSSVNKNEWKKGSAGGLVSSFINENKAELVMFAEDDFLPCPILIDDSSAEENMIPPDCVFPSQSGSDLEKALSEVAANNIYLQLSKSNYGWKKLKTSGSGFLKIVKHEEGKRSYSNWPWMMPLQLAKLSFLGIENVPIWQMESIVDKNLARIKHTNMCVSFKHHVHAGFVCSTRLDEFEKIGKFNFNRRRSASEFFGHKIKSLDQIRNNLMRIYFEGKRIKPQDLMSQGLYHTLHNFITA
jgi:hypothetical protein